MMTALRRRHSSAASDHSVVWAIFLPSQGPAEDDAQEWIHDFLASHIEESAPQAESH